MIQTLIKLKFKMNFFGRTSKLVKNRRYAALTRLIQDESYFSEVEMMNRNPLLYEELVGQYMSEMEKRMRDYDGDEPKTFVGALMSGIEKEELQKKKQEQQDQEADFKESDNEDEEEDNEVVGSSSKNNCQDKPVRLLWGEMDSEFPRKTTSSKKAPNLSISEENRILLKEEFISMMYRSFLDGKDDFDYSSVDNNDEYDNLEILGLDEEEKYFDSEEPENVMDVDASKANDDSEDELDIYMKDLNKNIEVTDLSDNFNKQSI